MASLVLHLLKLSATLMAVTCTPKAVVACPNEGLIRRDLKGCKEMDGVVTRIKTSNEDYPHGSKCRMEEWRMDMLLKESGLNFKGSTFYEKRVFAVGAFLWPDQL